jgi:LDH2 family malate/lactate/ureidoglycolate dehydrogenase
MPDDVSQLAPRVSHADLIRFIAAAYRAVGIPQADAAKAAELMAASDISGADGHGVFRLPQYIRRIKATVYPRMWEIITTVTMSWLISPASVSRLCPGEGRGLK